MPADDVPEFDAKGPELLYELIADHIEEQIRAGIIGVGTRLRPERELAEEYDVSYDTIRRAAVELRQRGLIRTIHGKGTYVLPPPDEE